ncbi:hypothetical protein CTAYLR_004131 [Chrysophaeum taylorii]|uniref:Inositol oxygenase n=1 Tax=Chrysophaeum taylorii TaxID=2483200 RepID=A0AAD7XP75_9STRA|nr:hypothetical protein CTAYLR_004131 [Chrysophaeum taylorii]
MNVSVGSVVGCSVCLSEEEEHLVNLRCGHRFCAGCLKKAAEHDHSACPTCRQPHELDPDELKARFEAYRSKYRSWRAGGVKGCVGEVDVVCAPPSRAKKVESQCKASEAFRDYDVEHARKDIVTAHYRDMRSKQTVAFVNKMHRKYSFRGNHRAEMTIKEAFDELEHYVDSSDPDLGLPNLIHMLQTAEGIRRAGHPDWFVLTGLIHDMGKIMYLWGTEEDGQRGTAEGPQWALGGDTFVVGCKLPVGKTRPGVVFPEFSKLNPDMNDPRYNTKFGMYEPNCGLDNLLFAYGHDEYLYQMLKANDQVTLPKEALAMIRYHSAYPWHTGHIYDHFMTEDDYKTLEWVLEFNKFDLYTKDESNPLNLPELWPYYQSLIDKYCPGKLKW